MRIRSAGAGVIAGLLAMLCAAGLHSGDAAAGTPTVATPASAPSVRDSPGYVPLHDPDSLDEVLGRRRNAKKVGMEFHGGPKSLDEMGRAVCAAMHTGRPDSLMALSLRSDEFRVILWPEFPQSRPATGLHWDDAWQMLWGHLNGGSVSAVREGEGKDLLFVSMEKARTREYRNFRLHEGITLTARDETGELVTFSFIRAIAERKGRFKIYSMRD